jgi:hypothetical protein
MWLTLLAGSDLFADDAGAVLREKVDVVINGVEEEWCLEWLEPPKPVCGPDSEDWMTCPCEGFVFGESGDLQLVRKRQGKIIEVFHLTPLFETNADRPATGAVLKRWDRHDDDFDRSKAPGFAENVKARPSTTVMKFADFDHDGNATEFMMQIGNEPCGKLMCLVVGVSRENPHLHAFPSMKNPDKPLILRSSQWDALAKAKGGTATVVDWQCGDHGSGDRAEVALSAQDGRISASRIWYRCNFQKKGRLIKRKEF